MERRHHGRSYTVGAWAVCLRGLKRRGLSQEQSVNHSTLEHWRYFILGMCLGALITGFIVNLMTQWVEHGDALYPARTRMSRKGRSVRYDLL